MGPRPTMPPVESDNADSNEEAGNIRDTLIGCRRHMNEQTGGQHHRVKPPLNKFVMLPCFFQDPMMTTPPSELTTTSSKFPIRSNFLITEL